MKNILVTTPIFYVNGRPHIGHAYTMVLADVLARFLHSSSSAINTNVLLSMGTDEHGQKVREAARQEGKDLKKFIEDRSSAFEALSKKLSCRPNRFIRTSRDKDHQIIVESTWNKMKTYIRSQPYTGYYSLSDESFISAKNLTTKNAKMYNIKSGKEVHLVTEDNYTFDISSFSHKLSSFLENDSIVPKSRLMDIGNSVGDIIKRKILDPISISRQRKVDSWGIGVPSDEGQVIYVWMDALLSYYTCLKSLFTFEREIEDVDIYHVLGKDILKFHCLMWPSIIFASNILPNPPKKLLVHGHWTLSGKKVSKSSPVMSFPTPEDIIDNVFSGNCDPLRYFLIKESKLDSDNEFSMSSLIKISNQDLSNQLGNLIHRTFNPLFISRLPKHHSSKNEELASFLTSIIREFNSSMKDYQFNNAIHIAYRILLKGNNIFTEGKPWDLGIDDDKLEKIVGDVSLCIIIWSKLMWPIIPETSEKVLGMFGIEKGREDCFINLEIPITFPLAGNKDVLFPRIFHN